jgi:hypothetical protein
MRASLAQATVRALLREELATQAFSRPSQTKGAPVCQPLYPCSITIKLLSKIQGGEDIAYGWKGKGSTVHLVTEGEGLPLAFLVTAANVSEVTVGLKVVDRVWVPRPKGRPKQRPASLGADKSYDSTDFRRGLRQRGIQPSIPRREWPNRRRRPGRLPGIHEASQSRWKVERKKITRI